MALVTRALRVPRVRTVQRVAKVLAVALATRVLKVQKVRTVPRVVKV